MRNWGQGKHDAGRYPDLAVENEGTVFTVTPLTDAGARWIGKNVAAESWQFHGQALCVEHRFIENIVLSAQSDGLRVI